MSCNVIFMWCQIVGIPQTRSSSSKISSLHHYDTEIVKSLNILWLFVKDFVVTLFSSVQVSDVIDVNVTEKDETFDMVSVMLK